jgi:hypothetical protein
MSSVSFAGSLDALGQWRSGIESRVVDLWRFLGDHELLDSTTGALLESLRQRLTNEKLVVAFVAEFSRGKSELINAIFFSDAGRRVLPATPGRTTMCPVELGYDAGEPAQLALLPIETRLEGRSVGDLRSSPRAWTRVMLGGVTPERLAEALSEVTRTKRVSQADARALGLWHDERPDDNPARDADGMVEVPAWRHALINYPHPLLQRGLVVLDTPGLNAIGAEPELTLGLLPSAHACVFILGADTGVTKSDLAIWRDHLGAYAAARYVVLNKIDALLDPLASADEVHAQIERQRDVTAAQLGVAAASVFPLSARGALAARVAGDEQALAASRLPELEHALGSGLLPQRRGVLERTVLDAAREVEAQLARRMADARRQIAEQTLELRGLRGKSSAKVKLMIERVDAETTEFEQCTTRLQALRAVQSRLLKDTMVGLSTDRLRAELGRMQQAIAKSLFNLGAKGAFLELCARLRSALDEARERAAELQQMTAAQFSKLNSEFGFSLAVGRGPDLERCIPDLDLIERNYVQYLGLSQALKLSEPRFMEQFRRMLLSKLRVLFENASGEIELWAKTAAAQVDSQLRERRRNFRRRREALERIQVAAGDLEQRLDELQAQDARLQQLHARAAELVAALRQPVHDGRVVAEPKVALKLAS